jgi:hypothetical protein
VRLIDQLQVAIFAVDERGGLTTLIGYSRPPLLSRPIVEIEFVPGHVSDVRWRGFLASRQSLGMTTITTRAGEDVVVHAASVAQILPGVHVAAFAGRRPRAPRDDTRER